MRRFVTLVVVLLCTVPVGVSLSGCSKAAVVTYCNGQTSGPVVGQTATLDLEPRLTGVSLNQGEISGIGTPSGRDCKDNPTTVTRPTYGSSDLTLVDIVPTTGRICAGTFNRQSGGGIPDFTICTPNGRIGTALVTATANGVSSNALPVFVHPVITSIVLGPLSANCATDPASNCYDPTQSIAQCAAVPPVQPAAFNGSCVSQGASAQLAARVFAGTGASTSNISCQVGPLTFAALTPSVVNIDTDGLATGAQPGSTIITAAASLATSSAGYFSTCPPASIVLTNNTSATAPTAPISVNQNTTQPLIATVTDTKGAPITNISLTFVSTVPTSIPALGSSVLPTFPGSAAITATCQPPTCNPSPFNQIGLQGNGLQVISNPVQITASGTNLTTVLYIASTGSQYLQPFDFTLTTQPSQVRLPFVPNSMVLSEDLSTLYLGSPTELMAVSTASNAVFRQDPSVPGTVLAVSPDNSTVIISDSARNLIYLYSSAGDITTEFGGVGTRAQFSPDSTTAYITTTDNRLLVHSTFTGWYAVPLPTLATDVAFTVPGAGVYLGGNPVDARTNCPATTISNNSFPNQSTTNVFYPDAGVVAGDTATRLTATNDGAHILGASTASFFDDVTNVKSGACPIAFTNTLKAPLSFTGLAATTINNVIATTDSAFSFVTFQGTGGVIPQYAPGTGLLTNIPLQKDAGGTPIAPLSGVISSDNLTLFVGTNGDNVVHRLTRGASGFTDTLAPIAPALPGINGGTAAPDLLVQRPRRSTS